VFQLTSWSILPLIVILLALWIKSTLTQMDNIPGTLAVKWLLVGVIIWSFSQLLRTVVTALELKLLATQLEMIGKQLVPMAWFIFTITFSNNRHSIPRAALLGLAIIPGCTLALTFSNSFHHLIWSNSILTSFGSYVGFSTQPGPWFYIVSIYTVTLISCGTAIAVHKLSQDNGKALPIASLILAPIIVAVITLTEDAGFSLLPGVNLAPMGLIAGALLLQTGVLSTGILTHKRVRRHTVVERLSDMVVIVDGTANVLDFNAAAEKGLNLQVRAGGRYPKLQLPVIQEMIRTNSQSAELTIGKRAYDVHATSLNENEGKYDADTSERALVFRDITQRRRAERALLEAKRELQTQAHTDPLTGLYNRRFFMQRLAEEGERLRRHNNYLSCLLFDLDHFKKINDTYGHDVGDKVLKMVSKMTNDATRITDVAARVGGEEFAMLLPETDSQGAAKLANRLRLSIASAEVVANNQRINVTASIGIVTVSTLGDNLDILLSRADKALYRAKDGGRNMVCIAN